ETKPSDPAKTEETKPSDPAKTEETKPLDPAKKPDHSINEQRTIIKSVSHSTGNMLSTTVTVNTEPYSKVVLTDQVGRKYEEVANSEGVASIANVTYETSSMSVTIVSTEEGKLPSVPYVLNLPAAGAAVSTPTPIIESITKNEEGNYVINGRVPNLLYKPAKVSVTAQNGWRISVVGTTETVDDKGDFSVVLKNNGTSELKAGDQVNLTAQENKHSKSQVVSEVLPSVNIPAKETATDPATKVDVEQNKATGDVTLK
ncbi:hypothetical protein, partial [Enterococcus faecium]|uniref:hypothetical protein n=1 Tax=Enterococcus faecium TaxID=1352 RepID=UPI0015C5E8AB